LYVAALLAAGAEVNTMERSSHASSTLHFVVRPPALKEGTPYDEVSPDDYPDDVDVRCQPLISRMLLDAPGTDVDPKQMPQHIIPFLVQHGATCAVEMLLERRANIDEKNMYGASALHFAAKGGNLEYVKLVLRYAPERLHSIDTTRRMPLEIALENGNMEVAEMLIAEIGG
jgi:ankyrin repeat domain-containing protein 1